MQTKSFPIIVVLAFLSIQTVSALQCYTCNGLTECQSPTAVYCDESSANKTSEALRSAFYVKEMRGSDYDCIRLRLTRPNNSTALQSEIRGCVYRQLDICSLPLNTTTAYGKICGECNKDLCNKSSAGKAAIGLFTVFVSILAVIIVKTIA